MTKIEFKKQIKKIYNLNLKLSMIKFFNNTFKSGLRRGKNLADNLINYEDDVDDLIFEKRFNELWNNITKKEKVLIKNNKL